jgi:hypothetical protein
VRRQAIQPLRISEQHHAHFSRKRRNANHFATTSLMGNMCRNDSEQRSEDLHWSLTYLQGTIHQAVDSIHSISREPDTMTAAAASDSGSSQVCFVQTSDQRKLDSPNSDRRKRRPKEPHTAQGYPRINLGHPQYRDYATSNIDPSELDRPSRSRRRGGAASKFQYVLHQMIEDAESHAFDDIICWLGHGRAWRVVHPERFVKNVMPKYFPQTKYANVRDSCFRPVFRCVCDSSHY